MLPFTRLACAGECKLNNKGTDNYIICGQFLTFSRFIFLWILPVSAEQALKLDRVHGYLIYEDDSILSKNVTRQTDQIDANDENGYSTQKLLTIQFDLNNGSFEIREVYPASARLNPFTKGRIPLPAL